MRHVMTAAAVTGLVFAGGATADFFAPGSDNGFDISGATSAMVETFGGSGIWEYNASGLGANARGEWNIVDIAGDWGSQLHGSNQWGTADANGDMVLTLDTNTYNDGWAPATNRIYTNTLASDSWAATGNWVGAAGLGGDWDLISAPAMTNNGGIFEINIGVIPAGTYDWKPVANGSWDSAGDGTGVNVNAGNGQFTSNGVDPIILQLDSSNATTRAIPTPGVAGVLGIAGLAAVRRRR